MQLGMKNMASVQGYNVILSYISSNIAGKDRTTEARRESSPKQATGEIPRVSDPAPSLCVTTHISDRSIFGL